MVNAASHSPSEPPGQPPSQPSGSGLAKRILAAIDVGTNSIHMVVVQVRPDLPAFTIIAREKTTVRLGDTTDGTGLLSEPAKQRALKALRQCCATAERLGAEQILAVATSAVREAKNGREFLEEVKATLGLEIDLISGPEEARRIYLGVLSGMAFDGKPHIIVDIGGGSTELILGSGMEPQSLTSTKIGAVRLTAEFVTTDPISADEVHYLQAYIRGMLERPTDELRSHTTPATPPQLIATSGTAEAIATLITHQKQGIEPERLSGCSITLSELQHLLNHLRRLNYEQRALLPGLNERRAEIIVAGALILQETMLLLGLNQFTVCERALREGLIVDWMLTHGLIEDRLRYQSSVRQRSVLNAAQKFQVNLPYGQRIATFALSLFDQLQGVLHAFDEEARDLLWAAAVLHNCGHHISHDAHHKHSYYLIRNAGLLGYTETQIETIANLARYHRKSGPKKKHDNYRKLTSKPHRLIVDQLHPLLRLAVALDRRQIGAIEAIRCQLNADQHTLSLHLKPRYEQDDCALELWSLEQKKVEFEQVYHLQVVPILAE